MHAEQRERIRLNISTFYFISFLVITCLDQNKYLLRILFAYQRYATGSICKIKGESVLIKRSAHALNRRTLNAAWCEQNYQRVVVELILQSLWIIFFYIFEITEFAWFWCRYMILENLSWKHTSSCLRFYLSSTSKSSLMISFKNWSMSTAERKSIWFVISFNNFKYNLSRQSVDAMVIATKSCVDFFYTC